MLQSALDKILDSILRRSSLMPALSWEIHQNKCPKVALWSKHQHVKWYSYFQARTLFEEGEIYVSKSESCNLDWSWHYSKNLSLKRLFFVFLSHSVLQLNFLWLFWVYPVPSLLLPVLPSSLSPFLLFLWAALFSIFFSTLSPSAFCSLSDFSCCFISGFDSCFSHFSPSQKPCVKEDLIQLQYSWAIWVISCL